MGFAHLHLHTEYSLLDGTTSIKKLFEYVKQVGQDSVAITEHGNLLSFVYKYQYAKQAGVKLIFGVEAYMVDDIKKKEKGQRRFHLLLLAKNYQGFKNLIKLVSESYDPEHFYYKPRIDKQLLAKYKEGLIATTGCLAAEVPQALMHGDYEKAKSIAQIYVDMFGKEDFYVELQNHGIPEQKEILDDLLRLSKELDLKPIATNDVHYLTKQDAHSQEVMLCIQTKTTMSNNSRMKFDTKEFYVKTEEEMRAIFPQCPEAIDNTVELADRCNVDLELGTPLFPDFPLKEGITDEQYLRELCEKGFEHFYGDSPLKEQAKERMEFELGVILNMGFAKYFLIVQDFIKAGKEICQVGPGRGSAAGSLVSYILGITQLEPISLGLLFERFLNPDRISLPDVDVDFGDRDAAVEYVINKYGADKVALIGTVGTMSAKSVVKDVARAMDIPFSISNEITKHIGESTIQKSLDAKDNKGHAKYPELLDYKKKYAELFEVALRLEGTVRHTGVHACGVVWGPKAIEEYTPIVHKEGYKVVQVDMNEVEELGLVKFDFLGLETLNVIQKVLEYIGKDATWLENLALDDADTYVMLRKGESVGVFQLESRGMQHTLKQVQPTNFDDIIAIVALYRPGPMEYLEVYARRKEGREKVTYPHPKAKDILEPTYGIMVYQEQVMQLSVELAGFSRGESDILRKAIGKKKLDLMNKMEDQFKQGCINNSGMDPHDVNALWDDIVKFAAYSFNKSHAAAYALISYRTAYLRQKYPVEFMAALISSSTRDPEKMSFYLETAKHMGIAILPPDINKSVSDFNVEQDSIRFGLNGIKNVGHTVLEEILDKRPFKDFQDFVANVDLGKVNKRIIENLIKSGCFDAYGYNRNQLLQTYEQFMKVGKNTGQMTLFGSQASDVEVPDMEPLKLMERLEMEHDVLGVYVSGHPLDQYPSRGGLTRVDDFKDGYEVRFMGIITDVKSIVTRNGQDMAFVNVQDKLDTCEVIVFPSVMEDLARKDLETQTCVFIEGKADNGKLIAARVSRVPKVKA